MSEQTMSEQYRKAVATYNGLADKAKKGDPAARADKAKAHEQVLAMEREAARDGKTLDRDKGCVVAEGDTKRSLQEQYVRSFQANVPVEIDGKRTNLRDYHRDRLLRR